MTDVTTTATSRAAGATVTAPRAERTTPAGVPTGAPAPSTAPRAGHVLDVDVLGIGAALPDRVVTNDDWSRTLETDDAWIRSRTGIAQRRIAGPDESTGTLALAAARAALADAGVDAADLGAVVVATTTPDRRMPGTAVAVAAELGSHAAAFDVQAVCAGFVTALRVAGPLVTADAPVLVIGAETMSRIVDPTDRSTAVLFGDGAGAVVLGTGRGGTLGPFDLGSDGTLLGILEVPAGGSLAPVTAATLDAGDHLLQMHGGEVYRQAVTHLAASSRAVLDAAGLEVDDVDLFVGHQANRRILDAVGSRLGLPVERQQLSVEHHGNTSAASVPLALADAAAAGRLRPGGRVLLTAFGAGLSWASCLLTIGPSDD